VNAACQMPLTLPSINQMMYVVEKTDVGFIKFNFGAFFYVCYDLFEQIC
jgi:hypothetical protein